MKRTKEENRIVVALELRTVDTLACNEIEEQLTEIMEECESGGLSFAFDLAEVDFIASSFLRLCLQASHKLGVEKVSIVNVSPPIKKVFKIAGFADHLTIV